MARGPSPPNNVKFAHELEVSCREPLDDELSVMEHFAKHAERCEHCFDPYKSYTKDKPLCSRGLSFAKDVANYLYAKGGKPFSRIEKAKGKRVQVNVPAGCEAVESLIKAFDKGMRLDAPRIVVVENTRRHETVDKSAKVVSPSSPISPSRRREYHGDDRYRERRYVRDDYDLVEIIPHSSRRDRQERVVYHDDRAEDRTRYERRERPKSVAYTEGKGSLYVRDEEERRRRERYDRTPVVIVAEPGQRFTTTRR
ncbi:uncharacterized protein Z520_11666 [Fonsecaea multimorphosa CBS 102226]|uniref:Uncharacterized protein n=1 Tax=Fonsecaea multimorphosa CBS 102226 TaxID=1442371 RepID=A0A0D2JHG7_9EURO|nr:uncharacterized protein Z520_11666 [Fonsecaea multimorphosa CBS 102226]KIX92637.1 hypothetical protein Z520_11666 [Fonsecaea multimorphosa CBS 102226]OAL17860.1 hypothetical protein AYO22_11204 [Fonsecaea multimorphosa]